MLLIPDACADIGMMLINSYVTMLIFLQIPAQMSILKAEQKYTFFWYILVFHTGLHFIGENWPAMLFNLEINMET